MAKGCVQEAIEFKFSLVNTIEKKDGTVNIIDVDPYSETETLTLQHTTGKYHV